MPLKKQKIRLVLIISLIIIFLITAVMVLIYLKPLYTISDANINKFHALTKENSFLFDPGTNSEFLKNKVQQLKNKDDEIVNLTNRYKNGYTEKNRDVLTDEWRLWPDQFLATLPIIHEQTNQFVNSRSRQDAIKLLDSYQKAAEEYSKSIEVNIKSLELILERSPSLKDTQIIFLGSATTPGIVYNDFLLIRANAAEIKKETLRRRDCLYMGNCNLNRTQSIQVSIKQQRPQVIPYEPLDKKYFGLDGDTEDLLGPFRATTGCFGRTETGNYYDLPFLIKVRTSKKTSQVFLKPMLSNTRYYKDFRQTTSQPSSQFYLSKNIHIRPHPEVNDYLCTDLSYLPDLVTQYLFQEKILTDPLSQELKLATLPYLINHTLSFSDIITNFPKYAERPMDPLHLLISRSGYSLYFGTFSPAVWRISQSPKFLIEKDFTQSAYKAGFKTFQDLKLEGMSDEDIVSLNSIPKFDEVFEEALSIKDASKETQEAE